MEMRTKLTLLFACLLLAGGIAWAVGSKNKSQMHTLSDGTTVVSTAKLGKKVKGFEGPTPLEVYIKSGKVVKIVPLENEDTPDFFNRALKGISAQYVNTDAAVAVSKKVDGVSGATYSSKAILANVKLALDYYNKNK